jgi:hypothetical protein
MKFILAAALITTALPGAALAKEAKPAKEKQICRQTNATGSRFRVSICHTEAEWAQIDEATKNTADANGRVGQPYVPAARH